MLEIIGDSKDIKVIPMKDMKPLQVGVVVEHGDYEGDIVMRTYSSFKFEVMDLTSPRTDMCWTDGSTVKVRLLGLGEYVTIKLFNEE